MGVWKEIRCDGPRTAEDCWSNLNVGPMGYGSVTDLHREARSNGWKVGGGEAICPVCRKEIENSDAR